MGVGGQDLICVRQKHCSTIPPAELRRHLEDLGDCLFSDGRSASLPQRKTRDGKQNVLVSSYKNGCFSAIDFLFFDFYS